MLSTVECSKPAWIERLRSIWASLGLPQGIVYD